MRFSAALFLLVLIQAAPQMSRPLEKGFVEGVVLETGSNQPIADAQVKLLLSGSPATPRPIKTDSQGRFTFVNVEAMQYTVVVDAVGFSQLDEGKTVDLSKRTFQTRVAIYLVRSGVASGRVLLDSKPGAAVEVRFLSAATDAAGFKSLHPVGSVLTDSRGEFRLNGVPPGRYYAVAIPPGADTNRINTRKKPGVPSVLRYPSTYYPSTVDLSKAEMIEIQSGGELRGLEFSVDRRLTYSIRGNLVDTRFNLPATDHVTISWHPRDPSSGFYVAENTVEMAADGTFEIQGLLPGKYWLEIKARAPLPDGDAPSPSQSQPIYQTVVPVDIVASDVDRLTVRLSPAVPIRGRITLDGGPLRSHPGLSRARVVATPVPGAATSLFMVPPPPAPPGFDGRFSFERVAPGDYRLAVESLPPDVYVKSATLGPVDVLKEGLQVSEPTSKTLDIELGVR